MAYNKTEWKDQDVENPRTYTQRQNDDGSVTLLDHFGTITELGTPVNAKNMNKIEEGIAAAVEKTSIVQNLSSPSAGTIPSTQAVVNESSRITSLMNNYVKKSGDTMTGNLINGGVFVANINNVGFIARSKSLVKGTTPTDSDQYVGYDWQDKNGQRLAYLGVKYGTNGFKRLELQKIDINLTEFYVGYVPIFAGNATIEYNGNARYKCKCTGYTKGTAPTASQFGGISTYDKHDVELATLYSSIDTNNTVTSALWVKQPTASGTTAKAISIYCDNNGIFHTSCRVASSENNSILTTLSHGDNYVKLGNGIQIVKGSIDTNSSRTATFEHPFKDTNYVCLAQTSGGTSDSTASILITPHSKTTTSVSFYSSRVSYVEFICIGYA